MQNTKEKLSSILPLKDVYIGKYRNYGWMGKVIRMFQRGLLHTVLFGREIQNQQNYFIEKKVICWKILTYEEEMNPST